MELVSYKDPSLVDIICEIMEADRQDPAFAAAEEQVEAVYRNLGAAVIRSKADAGEPAKPIQLDILPRQSTAMAAFSDRPA